MGGWADALIVIITVLAPAMAGSTELWAKATVTVLVGLVILLDPPARTLPPGITLLFVGFFGLALGAFLPADWFTPVPGRAEMTAEHHMVLPGTLTLQPWLSLEAILTLFAGMVWTYYLVVRDWTLSKETLLSGYAAGICALAVMTLAVFAYEVRPSFWPAGTDVGPFPNHNQSANVFALGGIICLALWWHTLARRRKASFIYLLMLILLAVTVVLINSRAGVVLLFGGCLVWLLWVAHFTKDRNAWAVGLISLFVIIFALFTFGEKAVLRLQSASYFDFTDQADGARMNIHYDALSMIPDLPWCGVGLGCFEPIFALQRTATLIEKRALHPESDWLWMCVEMGWPAPLLMLVALGWFIKGAWPFNPGTFARLRSAAALCVLLFLAHGLVDVSGHRVGSVWPALFLLAMAFPRSPSTSPCRWCSPAFRATGLLIVALGCAPWYAAAAKVLRPSATVSANEQRILEKMAANDFPAALRLIDETLTWAPLNWRLYYFRGALLALTSEEISPGLIEFQRARFLEPRSVDLPFREGKVWLQRQRAVPALQAWREALYRDNWHPGLFAQMLSLAGPSMDMMRGLGGWAQTRPGLMVHWLSVLPAPEFKVELERQLARDPNLAAWNSIERAHLFSQWVGKGDASQLAERLQQNRAWLAEGWRFLAQYRARTGDYRGACQIVRQFGARPKLPSFSAPQSLDDLRRAFALNANSFQAGYALFQRQTEQALWPDAGVTVDQLTALADCPKYFHFLAMELWCREEKWDRAWNAWQKFNSQ